MERPSLSGKLAILRKCLQDGEQLFINIYTDGASRENPGESASGYSIFDKDGNELFSIAFYNGIQTNNAAEYLAVIAALTKVAELYGYDNDIRAYTDSVLVARQISGKYKTKNSNLRKLNLKATELAAKFKSFIISNVPRETENIAKVDAELNRLLDEMHESRVLR